MRKKGHVGTDILAVTLPWNVGVRGCDYYVTGKQGRVTPDLGNSPYAKQLAEWIVACSKQIPKHFDHNGADLEEEGRKMFRHLKKQLAPTVD